MIVKFKAGRYQLPARVKKTMQGLDISFRFLKKPRKRLGFPSMASISFSNNNKPTLLKKTMLQITIRRLLWLQSASNNKKKKQSFFGK
jgi:hypothetical protein